VSSPGPLSSVDEVREQLRKLGYLDSGLDRFVLEGGAQPQSPARAALRVAGREALAGGVLLGLALTAAAAGLDPRLRAAPADLAVLFAYLFVATSLAVGVLAALVGLLLAAAAQRGHTPSHSIARLVGLGLAVPALLYFGFWWRSHAVGAGTRFQLVALALGALIVLALGRFGSLAGVAVVSAAGATGTLPRAPLSRRSLLLALGVSLAVTGAVVAAASWGATAPGMARDFAVIPTGIRVRLVAIDGLGRDLARQRMAAGDMPALAELLRRSAWGSLRSEPERVPLIVWTTVATGQGPEKHGVVAPSARRLAGMRTGVTVDEESRVARTLARSADVLRLTRAQAPTAGLSAVKAFWNVASDKGFRVGIVNWWATWPAEGLTGYVVSDRTLLRLDAGGTPEQEVHPPELLARLATLRPPPPSSAEGLASAVERARRIDGFHVEASLMLRKEAPPELAALYLPGLDIVAAQALQDPSALDVATLGERLTAVHDHCRWLDAALRRVLDEAAPQDVIVLVADPGRVGRRGDGAGLLALAGPYVKAGDLGMVSARDVAPTVLHLLGIPRSQELDGQVLVGAFAPEFRDANPVREVPSYGLRAARPPAESAFDAEVLEQLRSLGYIQ
jgi:hypothetical protein